MAGNTNRIDLATLRVQWSSYLPIAAICQYWSVTSHQLVRLRVVLGLEPRNDRKRRYKPTRAERMLDLDAAEVAASESSLDLAPRVAERATVIHASWTPKDWEDRRATKNNAVSLASIPVPEEARRFVDEYDG